MKKDEFSSQFGWLKVQRAQPSLGKNHPLVRHCMYQIVVVGVYWEVSNYILYKD
jgi:hypothetical protein